MFFSGVAEESDRRLRLEAGTYKLTSSKPDDFGRLVDAAKGLTLAETALSDASYQAGAVVSIQVADL